MHSIARSLPVFSPRLGSGTRAGAWYSFVLAALALVTGAPRAGASWAVSDAFTNLTFNSPCCFAAEPRSNRLYVCEREGRVYFFTNNPSVPQKNLFLDLSAVTQGYSDCGLLGFVFHPEFGLASSTNRGFVYVYYSYSPSPTNAPTTATRMYNRLSRFTVHDGSLVADPASELVLINQFDRNFWHNGGGMFFGSDGYLYVSNGDEGDENDSFNNAQSITNGFFSGAFRIDVDMDLSRSHAIRRHIQDHGGVPVGWPPTFSGNYTVPNDNPWLDAGGAVLEEYYAIGLRNPHRMTFDPPTGRIWVGDVGQETQEEVDLLQKGGNYQWSYKEGTIPGPKAKPAPFIGTDMPPLYTYGHTASSRCIIGGYVYRGSQFAPALTGLYLFGDYVAGRIWTLSYDGSSPPVIRDLCNMIGFSLSSFGVDQAGEIYMCSFLDGKIMKLTGRPDPAPIVAKPTILAGDQMKVNFTNIPGLSFSVVGTTNAGMALTNWSWLGPAFELTPGIYNFTNPPGGGTPNYFRVRQP